MSRGLGRVTAVVAALGVLVALVGAAYAAGLLGVPSVSGVDNRFAGVNETSTLIETDLRVSNPNPIGVSLGGLSIDYTVRLNDVPLANGSKQGVAVESGNSTLTFRTAMTNERIPQWWVSHLRNDQVTQLRIEFSATVELPTGTTVDVPLDRLTYTESIETDFFGNDGSGGGADGDGGAGEPTETSDGSATPGSKPTASTARPTGTAPTGSSPTPTPTPGDDGLVGNETLTPTDPL